MTGGGEVLVLEALAEEEEGEVGMEDMEEVLEVPSNKSRCIGGSTSTVWFFLVHTFPPLSVRREGVVSCNTLLFGVGGQGGGERWWAHGSCRERVRRFLCVLY